MERLYNGFTQQSYYGRTYRYAYNEPPRLYAQDPTFLGNFEDSVKDGPENITHYDFSFAIADQGSGFASSSQNILTTADSLPQQYTDPPQQVLVKEEEDDDYDNYLFDEFAYDKHTPTDADSDQSWSGSPGATNNDSIEDPPPVSGAAYTTVGLLSNEETESYLRQTIGIPSHLPVRLSSLPDDPRGTNKPTTRTLASLAIWGSPERKSTLHQIYLAVEERYPMQNIKPRRNSIRHHLSLKGIFRHEKRPKHAPGRGNYWFLDVRYGDEDKRSNSSKRRKEKGSKDKEGYDKFVHQVPPNEGSSRLQASTSFAHQPESYAMQETWRNTDAVGDSLTSNVQWGYTQPPERLSPTFTQDLYQQNLEYQSGNSSQSAPSTNYLQPFIYTEHSNNMSSDAIAEERQRQQFERRQSRRRQYRREQGALYVPNISGTSNRNNDARHRRGNIRRSHSNNTSDREVHGEERHARRTPPTTRRTR